MSDAKADDFYSIELQRAQFVWDLPAGKLSFFGLPAVLFWSNPSLFRMLQPLADEVGVPLFQLLVASNASVGTDEDYRAMVTVLGDTFAEGFLAWGRAVSTAGWGSFTVPHYDAANRTATVRVDNPWELVMQADTGTQWGCPFLQGKIIGIFSHAFGMPCWADATIAQEHGAWSVTFAVKPSNMTLTAEIARLREERRLAEQNQLHDVIASQVAALAEAQAEQVRMQEAALYTQAAIIAELSTPLIPITDHVVLMPLVGQIDSQRAQRVLSTLLEGVAQTSADYAILDITGLPVVDTHVASILLAAARAVRLLGTEVILTGIRPEVAQTLVSLGLSMDGIATRGTVQAGIALATEQGLRHARRTGSEVSHTNG